MKTNPLQTELCQALDDLEFAYEVMLGHGKLSGALTTEQVVNIRRKLEAVQKRRKELM